MNLSAVTSQDPAMYLMQDLGTDHPVPKPKKKVAKKAAKKAPAKKKK